METRKITLACFVGGCIGSALALLVVPGYWWFGVIAGFCAGYLSYEFREVVRFMPVAWKATSEGMSYVGKELFREIKISLARPRPFTYGGMILAVGSIFLCNWWLITVHHPKRVTLSTPEEWTLFNTVYVNCFCVIVFTFFTMCFRFLLIIIGDVGKEDPNCYCWNNVLRYREAYTLVAKGIARILLFLVWTIWKYLAIGIGYGIYYVAKFLWILFKLIHSDKRLLCGTDSAIGVLVTWKWLAPDAHSLATATMFVLFGGIIGATSGLLNWELVSLRILRVNRQQT